MLCSAKELELSDETNFAAYKEIFDVFWGKEFNDPFICMAGINSFNIDPYGAMSPCAMFSSFNYSLKNKPFGAAWNTLVNEYGSGPHDFIYPECKPCNMQLICPRCVAWSELETTKLGGKVESSCGYALLLEKKFFQKKEAKNEKENLSKTSN
jgi:radical SAM protein with 4Fe4S-binding SPASM domain